MLKRFPDGVAGEPFYQKRVPKNAPVWVETVRISFPSGRFADEWDAERDAGYPRLEALRDKALAPEILAFEEDLRLKLGERAVRH